MGRLHVLSHPQGYATRISLYGELQGGTLRYPAPHTGHVHLVETGQVVFRQDALPDVVIAQPSVVFYPQPYPHTLSLHGQVRLLCMEVSPRHQQTQAGVLPPVLALPLTCLPGLTEALAAILSDEDAAQDERIGELVMAKLLLHLQAAPHGEEGLLGPRDFSLAKALRAMQDAPGEPWTVATLAGLCGMSRSKFARRFRDVIGVTPADYLLAQRMRMAKRLLKRGRQVQEVARNVGYSTQPAFTRAFSAACKVSPRDWALQRLPGG